MVHTKTMQMLFCITTLMTSFNPLTANKEKQVSSSPEIEFASLSPAQKRDLHNSKLKVASLCAECAEIRQLKTRDFCTHNLNVRDTFSASAISAPQACLDSLNAKNICVQDFTVAGNFIRCAQRVAEAVYSTDTTYTLGDLLNFDSIIDDPENRLTIAPTTYTVPNTGYYLVTIQAELSNLQAINPVLGVPVSLLTLYVNGIDRRYSYAPFLTFSSEQGTVLSGMIRLNAGDVLTATLNVVVVDPVLGRINLSGTGLISGNGTDAESFFSIIYIASVCDTNSCPPCSVVQTPCPVLCHPCKPCCNE